MDKLIDIDLVWSKCVVSSLLTPTLIGNKVQLIRASKVSHWVVQTFSRRLQVSAGGRLHTPDPHFWFFFFQYQWYLCGNIWRAWLPARPVQRPPWTQWVWWWWPTDLLQTSVFIWKTQQKWILHHVGPSGKKKETLQITSSTHVLSHQHLLLVPQGCLCVMSSNPGSCFAILSERLLWAWRSREAETNKMNWRNESGKFFTISSANFHVPSWILKGLAETLGMGGKSKNKAGTRPVTFPRRRRHTHNSM